MAQHEFDAFVFDDVRYQLFRAGAEVHVDMKAMELLAYFLRNPSRLIAKDELLCAVWQGRALAENVLSVCIAKLRKALGDEGNRCVTSIYGRGYRFSCPVTVRCAVPSAPRVKALPVKAFGVARSPFLGRRWLTDQLDRALERAQSGRGLVVGLLGEAGIGKTRAAEELEARALQLGFGVARSNCHPDATSSPLRPFEQVLRTWGTQLQAVESNDQAWHQHVQRMTEAMTKACASLPQVVILEDVHWADAASLQLLSHWVTTLARLPVLLVITLRNTEMDQVSHNRRALDFVLGHGYCVRIVLDRLQKADIEAYTKLSFADCSVEFASAVYQKCRGNPFFMVELLRPLVGRRAPNLSELTISRRVLEAVRNITQRLAPETRDLLSAAAVIGNSFDIGLLASLTQRKPETLLELIESAVRSQAIVSRRNNTTQFSFGNELIRDVLYGDLPRLERARLDLKLAEILAARASSGNDVAHQGAALPAGHDSPAIIRARSGVDSNSVGRGSAVDAGSAFL